MIIVSGRITVRPGQRADFLNRSMQAVRIARTTPGCLDFVVAADPLEEDRVNVYEAWNDTESLLAFRRSGPSADMAALIIRLDIQRHEVSSSGSP